MKQSYVVTDQTKFGRRGLVSVAGFDLIGHLVTDAPVDDDLAALLETHGTSLIVAGSV